MKHARPVIGLLGGVASGKSTVASMLEAHGATVIDADRVGHDALHSEEVKEALVGVFGSEILDAEGKVDRKNLAVAAFGDPQRVEQLNNITHPWIRKTMRKRLDTALESSDTSAVVLDVSLLLESGAYQEDCDLLVFVESRDGEREDRAARTRGWDMGEVSRRQAHQLPLESKREQADWTVENNGSLARLEEEVLRLWQHVAKTFPTPSPQEKPRNG